MADETVVSNETLIPVETKPQVVITNKVIGAWVTTSDGSQIGVYTEGTDIIVARYREGTTFPDVALVFPLNGNCRVQTGHSPQSSSSRDVAAEATANVLSQMLQRFV